MIVRILSAGKSFQGLATYLTHDPKRDTAERVSWTHTHNLAHDHVPSAVDEMLWTARSAELLKQEAGVRAGGRATENTVKHLSLNWAPGEQPTQAHMIETAAGFLRHMRWEEHQALMVAHTDTAHPHVHLAINMVHPETGLRLDDNFERRRAQAWALAYEKDNGRIYCEQRLLNPEEREPAPTRPAWRTLEKNRENAERDFADAAAKMPPSNDNSKKPRGADWQRLKEMQREERINFFTDGKSQFSELRQSIYRDVRGDFRERWQEFYDARRDGTEAEALAAMKAQLVAEQQIVLQLRSKAAFDELRTTRNELYRTLLDEQQELRHTLRTRQEAGRDNSAFLDGVAQRRAPAAEPEQQPGATTAPHDRQSTAEQQPDNGLRLPGMHNHSGTRSPGDVAGTVSAGLGLGVLTLFGNLADGLLGGGASPPSRTPANSNEPSDLFDAAAAEAVRQHEQQIADAEADWRKRQRSLEGE